MRSPLRLDESAIIESEEVSPGVVLDDDDANEVVTSNGSDSRNTPPRSTSPPCNLKRRHRRSDPER